MTKVLGISGSLRSQSYNTALLRAAKLHVEPQVEFDLATLHGIPLYDGDLEQKEGLPQAVSDLKARIMACDGVLLATPEYNNGIPGVFKNAIDWLSRPTSDIPTIFGNRPFAVVGASLGGFGTVLAQNDWLPVLKALGTRQWSGGRLLVSRAHKVFSEAGDPIDESTQKNLHEFMQGFLRFIQGNR